MELNFKALTTSILITGSSITILNPSVNIGSIKQGLKKEIVFNIRNNSSKNIRIYSVTSSCGCTIPKYPNQLDAQKTTAITAIFESKDFKGKVNKDLVLLVDDKVKYYKLSFTATVE